MPPDTLSSTTGPAYMINAFEQRSRSGSPALATLCAIAAIVSAIVPDAVHGQPVDVRATATSAGWPTRPLRMIVPLPPGGAADLVARITSAGLAEALGQPVVVENRPGAGTNIGPALVAKSAPDGYTLLLASVTNHAVSVKVYPSPGYDLTKSFTPVALLANAPHILIAHPSLPVRSVRDTLALARKQPRDLLFGSQGTGSLAHLEIELLHTLAGAQFTHVPYKGSGPAKADLLAGHIHMMFDSYASAASLIREKRVRVIAIASDTRSTFLPDVPTFIEAGVPNYAANNWYGLMVPAGSPGTVVKRLSEETARVLGLSTTRERFASLGLELTPGGPARLAEVVTRDLATWGPVIQRAKITAD